MKIQRSDLDPKFWSMATEEIFASVPMNLFELLGDKQFLSFHYEYDEVKGMILDIKNLKIVPSIDIKMYQNQPHNDKGVYYKVGFFQFPLDTQNSLLYQFLKYYFVTSKPKDKQEHATEKLSAYYSSAKAKDLEGIAFRRENTVYNNVFKVYGRDTFVSAVNRFVLAQGDVSDCVLAVADAIDYHCKGVKNKSLYGSMIEKIVMAIPNSEGGLVPDKLDRLRYLYVGENSFLSKEDKALDEAKEMFRNGDESGDIFTKTSWYFNRKDQKWRKRVSDVESSIATLPSDSVFIKYGSKFSERSKDIYQYLNAPNGVNSEALNELLKSGWDVYLSDVFTHPTLYKHYPSLFKMPIFYASNSISSLKDNNSYRFYYTPQGKYLCIVGNPNEWDFKNVLLHEIQHAIQDIEGFATGGNTSISRLIQAIGGANVKNYFFIRKNIVEKYKLKANQNGKYNFDNFSKHWSKFPFHSINNITEKEYYEDCTDAVDRLVSSYVSETAFTIVIKNYIDDDEICKCLDTLADYTTKHANAKAKLMGQGFSEKDVHKMIHASYEALLGEVEARDVQNTYIMQEELQDYLLPITSEAILDENINVFFDKTSSSPVIPAVVKGAVETTLEDKYIIHLFPNFSSRPLLHELGHILCDVIGKDIVAKRIFDSFGDQSIIDLGGTDEIFCELFLCYLSRQPFPSRVINDLRKGRVDNDKFGCDKNALTIFEDEFNAVFHPTEDDEKNRAFMSRILFVQKMNDLLHGTGEEAKQEEPTPIPAPIPEKPKEADIDTEDMSVVDWVDWVDDSNLIIHYDGDTQLQLLSIEPFDDKDMFSSNWVSIVNFEEYFDGKRFSKEAIRGYVISLLKQAMLDTIRKESATSTTLKHLIYLKPKNTEPTPPAPTKKDKQEKKELVQKIEWVKMQEDASDLVLYYNNGDSLHLMQIQTNADYQPPRDFLDSVWLKEGLFHPFLKDGQYEKEAIRDYIILLLQLNRLATIQKEDVRSTTLSSLYLFNEEQKPEEKKGDKAYDSLPEFIVKIKALFKKNEWHFINEEVNGHDVQIKFSVGREVYVQKFIIDGLSISLPINYAKKTETLEMMIGAFNKYLK